MQNTALNHQPYGASDAVIRSERSIEFQAFARVTSALALAEDTKDTNKLAQAVYENRKLWNILASDVAEDQNELPEDLRANIISLSLFVMRHSSEVLKGNGATDTLIEINKSIMRGLKRG